MNGYNLHRHESNPKEKELHDKFNDIVLNDKHSYQKLDRIIFGTKDEAQEIPKDELSERETKICVTLIQWLGSPTGQYFLSSNGFELTNNK